MKAQLYTLDYPNEEVANSVAPGQFVFLDDDSHEVMGFVADVSDTFMTICLFKPHDELPPGITIIEEELTDDEVIDMLEEAVLANPAVEEQWMEALGGPTLQ